MVSPLIKCLVILFMIVLLPRVSVNCTRWCIRIYCLTVVVVYIVVFCCVIIVVVVTCKHIPILSGWPRV